MDDGHCKKKTIPFALKYVLPEALTFGQNVLSDLEKDKTNIKQTLRNRSIQSLKNVGKRIVKGGGKVRKRKRACYKRDVFKTALSL